MSRIKLLVSVFTPEEAREAIVGGADIIDCEDPRADVGMFEPRVVTDISYAVRQSAGEREIPTSANIGFDLQTFERAASNHVTARSAAETRAKAAQEALGLAVAMDVGDQRPNIIKFGVDGIRRDEICDLVAAVKRALRNSRGYQNHRVVGSFLVADHAEWARRRADKRTIRPLLELGQFYLDEHGPIDLRDHLTPEKIERLVKKTSRTRVSLVEPYEPVNLGMPSDLETRMRDYVDLISAGGADGVMIDTPIQAKMARICLIDMPRNGADDCEGEKLPRHGVFPVSLLGKFMEYCAFQGVESWLAGSIQPYQAVELSGLDLDVLVCRGSVSAIVRNPFGGSGPDDRTSRRISRGKVAAMARSIEGEEGS